MTEARRDLYELLGVPRDAEQHELKSAYRRLAKKYHPDLNPHDTQAHAHFIELRQAIELLSDPRKRSLYDEFGHAAFDEGFDADATRRARRQQRAQQAAEDPFNLRDARGFESVFGDVFRAYNPFRADFFRDDPKPKHERGADLRETLPLDLLAAVRGGVMSLTRHDGALAIRLPPNVEDGYEIKVPGEGERASMLDGERGDLYLVVQIKEHPYLSREGLDLTLVMPISMTEAILGAQVSVPTPHGECNVTIPEGVHSGTRLRLKEMGARVEQERGDFYIVLEIRAPTRLSAEVREAALKLNAGYTQDIRAGWKL